MKYKNKFVIALVSALTFYTIAVNAQPSGDIYIKARHSNKCLHIREGGQINGLIATQWDCKRQNNLIWKLEPLPRDPGFFFIRVKSSDKCLHVHEASKADSARISQWQCSVARPNLKWKIIPTGDGYNYIQAQHSKKCLHVHEASQEKDALITQWSCVDKTNVQWKIEKLN
jgi:agarase